MSGMSGLWEMTQIKQYAEESRINFRELKKQKESDALVEIRNIYHRIIRNIEILDQEIGKSPDFIILVQWLLHMSMANEYLFALADYIEQAERGRFNWSRMINTISYLYAIVRSGEHATPAIVPGQ